MFSYFISSLSLCERGRGEGKYRRISASVLSLSFLLVPTRGVEMSLRCSALGVSTNAERPERHSNAARGNYKKEVRGWYGKLF